MQLLVFTIKAKLIIGVSHLFENNGPSIIAVKTHLDTLEAALIADRKVIKVPRSWPQFQRFKANDLQAHKCPRPLRKKSTIDTYL